MSFGFHLVRSHQECNICLDTVKGMKIAHNGENGDKHPFHPECIAGWLVNHLTCPGCESLLDRASIINAIPLQDRVVRKLKFIAKDALTGIAGLIVAGGLIDLSKTMPTLSVQIQIAAMIGLSLLVPRREIAIGTIGLASAMFVAQEGYSRGMIPDNVTGTAVTLVTLAGTAAATGLLLGHR